jgi:Mn-dependent DtxR family transcriptional regulator
MSRKRFNTEDVEKAIESLINERNGLVHYTELAARLGMAPSTAALYMKVYAKKHGIRYDTGHLWNEPVEVASTAG